MLSSDPDDVEREEFEWWRPDRVVYSADGQYVIDPERRVIRINLRPGIDPPDPSWPPPDPPYWV